MKLRTMSLIGLLSLVAVSGAFAQTAPAPKAEEPKTELKNQTTPIVVTIQHNDNEDLGRAVLEPVLKGLVASDFKLYSSNDGLKDKDYFQVVFFVITDHDGKGGFKSDTIVYVLTAHRANASERVYIGTGVALVDTIDDVDDAVKSIGTGLGGFMIDFLTAQGVTGDQN